MLVDHVIKNTMINGTVLRLDGRVSQVSLGESEGSAMSTKVVLHLVSPASGDVVEAMARTIVSQLHDVTPVRHFWQMVRKQRQVDEVLAGVGNMAGSFSTL